MHDDDDYSVGAARSAAAAGTLEDWVTRFLGSPGSDNAQLGEQLADRNRWWTGPVELPIDQLHRLAGPAGSPVLCPVSEDEWDERVDDLEQRVGDGWLPPPVIVTFRGDQLVLEDGNHRVEGLRRTGATTAWAVVGFEDPAARDRFAAVWGTPRHEPA
jgi:hypothetical protein